MPEHLRSLVVILFLAISVFAFFNETGSFFSSSADFNRRRNLWLGLTLIVFLAHDFWIYVILAGILLIFTSAREKNKVALFFFLLFAVPPISAEIPAFGLINFIFSIDHIRLLELAIFLPVFLTLSQLEDVPRFGKTAPDKFILFYVLWCALLLISLTSLTNTLRQTFYFSVDILLPYFVISRSLRSSRELSDALSGFVVAAMVLAAIGVFELFKGWLLYSSLNDIAGVAWNLGQYLNREGSLRAMASTGQSIVLGYVMVIALGFFLAVQRPLARRWIQCIWLALLLAGLIAPQSRGPWIGAGVLLLVFIATGPQAARRLMGIFACVTAAIPLLLASPLGEKIISYLPFVGTVEQENVTYRQLLIENSTKLVLNNPFFGVPNAMATSEMQSLRQGQGIIDIVNTYVAVALGSGLIGLALFISVFLSIGLGIFKAMRSVSEEDVELYLLGRVLLSTLTAIVVMIGTVSSISLIPVIYWSVAGLGLAYIHIVMRFKVATGNVSGASDTSHVPIESGRRIKHVSN